MSESEDYNLRPPIPKNWRIMPLASVSIGGAHNGYFKKPELVGAGYKLINVSELYQSFGIDTDHAKVERVRASIVDYSRYGVHDGDIFFTRSSLVLSGIAACNVLRKVKEPTLFECHVMRIVPDRKQVDSDFVAYCCRDSFSRSYLMSRAKQTTMTTISQPEIEQLPIPVPPLPQQRKIARILTTLDNLITQTEALIAKYQAIKQGLMHDLFTRGVDATGKLRPPQSETPELYKQSELGWIPKEWEVCRLEAVSLAIVDCPHSTPEYLTDGVLVARTSQIKDGRFESVSASYVSELEYFVRVSRLEPRPDDVIFTREAPVGEAFVIPYGMRICLGQRVMLVRLDAERCEPHFFLQLIYTSKMRQRFDQQTGGTTNPHLNVVDIRELQIVVPALREQVAISRQMMKLVAKCNAEMQYLTKLRTTKSGLMQDLLTGKVRVNAEV